MFYSELSVVSCQRRVGSEKEKERKKEQLGSRASDRNIRS